MPNINPKILIWARETAGFSVEQAARKLQFKDTKTTTATQKLSAYENGKQPPSRTLLVRMAKQYRRPLLAFYLPSSPRKADRGEDYRTLSMDIDPAEEAIIDALVRSIEARQSILKEALLSEGDAQIMSFIGSYSMDKGVAGLVREIFGTASLHLDDYRAATTQNDALKYLRARMEGLGIFTLLAGNLGTHHTKLSPSIFRGFALSDEIAPFIVINDQDAKTAQCFTLLHEVAHLWLGVTGISGGTGERRIERFCNDVASEILLPDSDMQRDLRVPGTSDNQRLMGLIDEFARQKKVSSGMVAYRLLRRGAIEQSRFETLTEMFHKRWEDSRSREQKQKKDGGPDYYVVQRSRLGNALLNTAQRMLASKELSTTQVGTVLGVRALKVGNLFSGDGQAA
uniref:Zn-dependent peptidase ImmA, M78 family n=1 Tax=Candidatus Kentrum sp. LFY TaxID=2126342 RepID=A0A450UEA0_9GAMM|nr:MAG: Zn-dependent peptidase ImmA, M78 family [Candidatus Kentron sp. LFY]